MLRKPHFLSFAEYIKTRFTLEEIVPDSWWIRNGPGVRHLNYLAVPGVGIFEFLFVPVTTIHFLGWGISVIFDLTFFPRGREFESNFWENVKIPPYPPPLSLEILNPDFESENYWILIVSPCNAFLSNPDMWNIGTLDVIGHSRWAAFQLKQGAPGSRYQSIFDLTPPMHGEIDHHTGNYVPYSFRQVRGFFY